MTPDLLNFKKGWMSKLDESGEWRKHWFVLTDAGLKYYRDSTAEEKDEVDGEIDLKSCVNVSEFDVEKNYGFQIQTREALFTLSAMTAGIRRNWIEVLRKSIRPNGSPDLTQLPDCSADKENTRHTSSYRHHSQSEAPSTTNPTHSKFDYVELSRVATSTAPTSASQRESGEGQVREHGQWQEDRSRDASHSQWEAVLSRKGVGELTEQRRLEEEIEKKWAELSCIDSLHQMERVHREALEEMEKHHAQQIKALEKERDALLREETEATARVMKVLQKAHRAELEKTTQLADRDGTDTHTHNKPQQAELASLRRELEGLSERYSQKCLELNEAQQQSKERERQMSQKDRQLEQLKRDNQDLQVRLSEEIKIIGSGVRGQGSDDGVTDGSDRSWCEMQVLLRVRENELQYLHKELSCLRNQLHFLTTEKNSVCDQYRDVCEELSVMKSRSEREIETLRDHLRLALNALQDGQHPDNSLQH